MSTLNRREVIATGLSLTVLPAVAMAADEKPAEKPTVIPKNAMVVIVTDPLSAQLACPCVKGYAQRDYDKLGKHIESKLGRTVVVVQSESLAGSLKKSDGRADLIIGKDSVIRAHAAECKLKLTHLAALTGLDGKTTQTGLICVAATDKAITPADLAEYTVYLGSPAAEEKHAAALQVFKDFKVALPAKPDTCATCSDAAMKVVEEAKAGQKVAGVISSYAHPLLEGCGTIKKGDLRVVGETEPVPFIAAFATGNLSLGDRDIVKAALLEIGKAKDLCTALETKVGFVEPEATKKK